MILKKDGKKTEGLNLELFQSNLKKTIYGKFSSS